VRDDLLRLRGAREHAREGVALDVVHHEVVAAVALTHLLDGHDVRMMDARREQRLVAKHLDELGLARQVRMQPLDGDEPLQAPAPAPVRALHSVKKNPITAVIAAAPIVAPRRMLVRSWAERPSLYAWHDSSLPAHCSRTADDPGLLTVSIPETIVATPAAAVT